jgi:hypothetical protein
MFRRKRVVLISRRTLFGLALCSCCVFGIFGWNSQPAMDQLAPSILSLTSLRSCIASTRSRAMATRSGSVSGSESSSRGGQSRPCTKRRASSRLSKQSPCAFNSGAGFWTFGALSCFFLRGLRAGFGTSSSSNKSGSMLASGLICL